MGEWFELCVNVRDGRYFPHPGGRCGLAVRVLFAGVIERTQSVFDYAHPEWREDVIFRLSGGELKELKRKHSPIRVECFSPESVTEGETRGRSLGYVLIDMRTAELNYSMKSATPLKPGAPTARSGGKWFQLLRSGERQPPELRLFPTLGRVHVLGSGSPSRELPLGEKALQEDEGELLMDGSPRAEELEADLGGSAVADIGMGDEDVGPSPVYRKAMLNWGDDFGEQQPREEVLHVGEGMKSFTLVCHVHGAFRLHDMVSVCEGVTGPVDKVPLLWVAELLGAHAHSRPFVLSSQDTKEEGTNEADPHLLETVLVGRDSLVFSSLCEARIPVLSSETELATLFTSPLHCPRLLVSLLQADSGRLLATAQVPLQSLSARSPVRFRQPILCEGVAPASEEPKDSSVDGEVLLEVLASEQQAVESVVGMAQPVDSAARIEPGANESVHHWRFSVDLRSLRDVVWPEWMHGPDRLVVFLRYAYPSFGSAVPISTEPPVEIQHGAAETLLSSSFCLFEFASKLSELTQELNDHPLVAEAVHRDPNRGDVCFATVNVPLHAVMEGPDMLKQGAEGKKTRGPADKGRKNTEAVAQSLQVYDTYLPLFLCAGAFSESDVGGGGVEQEGGGDRQHACGYVRCVLTVEDMGVLRLPPSREELERRKQEMAALHEEGRWQADKPGVSAKEYTYAWELDLWKKNEEKRFRRELEEKERVWMDTIAQEWKKRERDRQLEVRKDFEGVAKLEEQARRTMAEVEKREKVLKEAQTTVSRTQKQHVQDHAAALQATSDQVRRQKEESDHQVELMKRRLAESDRTKKAAQQQVKTLEKRYSDLESAFAAYRRKQLEQHQKNGSSVAPSKVHKVDGKGDDMPKRVQELTESNTELRVKLAGLQAQLEHCTQAKDRCMFELEKAVATVRQLRREKSEAEAAKIQQEREELAAERARLEEVEEAAAISQEQQQLADLKSALSQLKMQEARMAARAAMIARIQETDDLPEAPPLSAPLLDPAHYHAPSLQRGLETLDASQERRELPLNKPELHSRVSSVLPDQDLEERQNQLSEQGDGKEMEDYKDGNVEESDIDPTDHEAFLKSLTPDRAAQLIAERDDLLATGVYTETDAIVQRLSVLIQLAQSHMKEQL